jgi:hypothetical protein
MNRNSKSTPSKPVGRKNPMMYRAGRSSDFQANPIWEGLLSAASQPCMTKVSASNNGLYEAPRRSFLITAAGQFRYFTGFPLSSPLRSCINENQRTKDTGHRTRLSMWLNTARKTRGSATIFKALD